MSDPTWRVWLHVNTATAQATRPLPFNTPKNVKITL